MSQSDGCESKGNNNVNGWFEIDVKGLRELYAGKPKYYPVRELIANALDEEITTCAITTEIENGIATIKVIDDSPEGFVNLCDAYTLFGTTRKRANPNKRGIFNFGEKQAIATAEFTTIKTTKGTITFTTEGRRMVRKKSYNKTDKGTIVEMAIKMCHRDYEEMLDFISSIIPPKNMKVSINGFEIVRADAKHEFTSSLQTTILDGTTITKTVRKTMVELFEKKDGTTSRLLEMGIPVCPIECIYDVNVDQRVPLNQDRDMVLASYMQDLYAEILNRINGEITPEISSAGWVRQAMSDDRIAPEAVKAVIEQRYGDKVAIFNPNDAVANDDAIANGYRVIHGSENSAEEWQNIKSAGAISSTTSIFGRNFGVAEPVKPTPEMERVGRLTEKIAKDTLGFSASVSFIKMKTKMTPSATFSGTTVTFYVSRLGVGWFGAHNLKNQLDLIIHEIAHRCGMHTEARYHEALSKIGAELAVMIRDSPKYLDE